MIKDPLNKAIKITRPPWIAKPHPIFTRLREQQQGKGNYSKNHKEYNNTEWRNYSKSFLADNPHCAVCDKLAHLTDHAISMKMGGSKWDRRNHQAMCHKCHNIKRAAEGRGECEPYVETITGRIPARRANEPQVIGNQSGLLK